MRPAFARKGGCNVSAGIGVQQNIAEKSGALVRWVSRLYSRSSFKAGTNGLSGYRVRTLLRVVDRHSNVAPRRGPFFVPAQRIDTGCLEVKYAANERPLLLVIDSLIHCLSRNDFKPSIWP